MFQKSEKNIKKKKRYNKKLFIFPVIVWIIGFILFLINFKLTKEFDNRFGITGCLVLGLGTSLFANASVKEHYRLKLKTGFPLYMTFLTNSIVEDYDQLTSNMSSFKESYSEFMNADINKSNSKMQDYATQMLWHRIYLQKKRMEKLGVQMELEGSRVSYSKEPVRSVNYFDGRYDVSDVYEEIYAVKTFWHKNRDIKRIYNKEVAHYTFLSAKKDRDKDKVICPSCGNASSRSNLIDGCDFCGTKFTIEDLDDRVASFGFRRDLDTVNDKYDMSSLLFLFSWLLMTLFYMGFFIAFIYPLNGANLFLNLVTGLVYAVLLTFCGDIILLLLMFITPLIIPLILIFGGCFRFLSFLYSKFVYFPKEIQDLKKKITKEVRKSDPLFSIESFFGGVQNKLYAIHFADTKNQVNAFSDLELSSNLLEKYEKVVDIETVSLSMTSYRIEEGVQIATVIAYLLLRKFENNKIKTKKEFLKIQLEKSEHCKTQAVCGPSILKCKKCGGNLSLLEGKICKFCGNELDMREHDWIITKYDSMDKWKNHQ
ncbi:zinc ribbon domain-containing protein [Leptotrichia alba]|uniref:Zinc ribbon domain-containing protein n=1 Tax=Leptotrichia alba TaxID=3239304 RepID=A0AB39V7H2_9FUSO